MDVNAKTAYAGSTPSAVTWSGMNRASTSAKRIVDSIAIPMPWILAVFHPSTHLGVMDAPAKTAYVTKTPTAAIPHGIAVSIGCDMANYCASRLGVSNEKILGSMSNTFRANYQGYETINIPFELFISALDKDKKNIGKGSFSLILPNQKAKLFRDSYSNNHALRGIFKDFFAVLKN